VGTPFVHVHRVRFDEIDAAGIVYFACFFTWCHDAMEAMLGPIDGGYVGLVRTRKLGLPAVHVEADYAAPLHFGDGVRIAVVVERVGRSSVALRFELSRLPDSQTVATIRHVVALTDLTAMRALPLPDDVREVLERHLVAA
jgi:4-hydroxybenzoyl-CoA thioesterase